MRRRTLDHIGSLCVCWYTSTCSFWSGESVQESPVEASTPTVDLEASARHHHPTEISTIPRNRLGRMRAEFPDPLRCFSEPVRLSAPVEEHDLGLTYIKATADGRDTVPGGEALRAAAERAKRSDRWRYFEIHTTHMVANNRPERNPRLILLQLAEVSITAVRCVRRRRMGGSFCTHSSLYSRYVQLIQIREVPDDAPTTGPNRRRPRTRGCL